MSITDNTTALRYILSVVQELPEAGGGGVNVQRVEGNVTTDGNGEATVNCGFKPDYVVIINPRVPYSGYVRSATAHFAYNPEGLGAFALLTPELSDDVFANSFDLAQTDNGFRILAENISYSFEYSIASNATFNYYAVKYE